MRRSRNLKKHRLKIMHMVIIHLQQLSKVVFGSSHYHVLYEFGSQDDNIFDSLYVTAVIPCLVNCFNLLIQFTQKKFVKRGAIISRLHVAVEYLSKSTSSSVTKNQKQLPAPLSEATSKSISTFTANKRSSRVPDVTMKRFCQLMPDEHTSALYQIMDILLSGHGSFVRETSNSFNFVKNDIQKVLWSENQIKFYFICFTKASNFNSFTSGINGNFSL